MIESLVPDDLATNEAHRRFTCGLTVELKGRTEALGHGFEGVQFPCARGATEKAHHGPLQRVLDGFNT